VNKSFFIGFGFWFAYSIFSFSATLFLCLAKLKKKNPLSISESKKEFAKRLNDIKSRFSGEKKKLESVGTISAGSLLMHSHI
jgi:hypothetical protein